MAKVNKLIFLNIVKEISLLKDLSKKKSAF
jgi:hypothetical protein